MLLFTTTDFASSIGRVNPSMLADQDLVELLFTPKDWKAALNAFMGDELDVCTWNGVKCDEDSFVTSIEWHAGDAMSLKGSINFAMFPQKLEHFNLFQQRLVGEVDTSNLPPNLTFFCIQNCFFTGTVDMGNLPRGLETFWVFENRISKLINVQNLPETLLHCEIDERGIKEEELFVGKLPEGDFRINFWATDIKKFVCEDPNDRNRLRTQDME